MPATKPVTIQEPISLSELLGGDEVRVRRVLRAFANAASDDLLQLDGAVRDGNGERVRKIAGRLAMACHLVGEASTGHCLDAVARVGHGGAIDPVMTQHIARARVALIDSIALVAVRVERGNGLAADGDGSNRGCDPC